MNHTIYPTTQSITKEKSNTNTTSNSFKLESQGKQWNKPPMNVFVNADEMRLDFYAAGLDRENINIRVEDQILTIKHQTPKKQIEDKFQNIRKEYIPNDWTISFKIAPRYDIAEISTRLTNGILQVNVPRHKKWSRQIEVN